ncbi:MAG: glycosyltransferase [Paracoccus sp. (in: a-proteobacteria)]|uniref:glycosyltransferase n=1 Tax=Paracoccaceae TaxID=31989 RepID=UPI004058A5B5
MSRECAKVFCLGYLVPEFPGQTHAFFWREIQAIEDAGTPVRLYSTRRLPPGSCPHAFAGAASARTTYLFPPRLSSSIRVLIGRPLRLARAISYVARLHEMPVKGRLRLLALLPSAAKLVDDADRHGVDHLHIHSCANAAHLGALANILGSLPYSLTLHGDLPVYGTDHAAKMRRAKFVAAVTRPLAEQVRHASPTTDAPVIWMGVDCARFAPVDGKGHDGAFTVATVARLNPAKGHRFFLRAMAALKSQGIAVTYLLAGDGPERPAIEAEIDRLGLNADVRMLGALDETQIRDLLGAVDAVALTSVGQGEAAPVTVMEAMARGIPVICSRIGGTPDMIIDGVDGFLVPQEDVVAIAERLELLVSQPERAKAIGRAARLTAIQKFDHRRNAGRLLDHINAS